MTRAEPPWSATVLSASSTRTPAPISVASWRVTSESGRAPRDRRERRAPGRARSAVGSTETGISARALSAARAALAEAASTIPFEVRPRASTAL